MRVFTPESAETPKDNFQPYSIFLAGGITGCPDWQEEALSILESSPVTSSWDVYNPRRKTFDVSDPTASDFQIEWEHKHLRRVHEVFFWFPKEGQCMITLLELGWALGRGCPIRVGCHPEYVRAFDVRKQTRLAKDDDFPIAESLEELFSPPNFVRGVSRPEDIVALLVHYTGKPLMECRKAAQASLFNFHKAVSWLDNSPTEGLTV